MPTSGSVRLFHASEIAADDLRQAGFASSKEIADLQNSAGTRERDIVSIAEVEVDAELLEYERSNDDVHIFYLLDGDPFTVVSVDDWPEPNA
jgi:hypothetical protein